jgi:hypothetical protein
VITTAAPRRRLSERAKTRLRAARRLLQAQPTAFGLPAGWRLDDAAGGFYEACQAAVVALADAQRERLRELVDWVESYEAAEAAEPAAPAPAGAKHRH